MSRELAFVVALAAAGAALAKESGPAVGALAPELGPIQPIQRDPNTPTSLAKLRGTVVVVHTFAWQCDSCVKKGLPITEELLAANADRGLAVISITHGNQPDETRKALSAHHMTQNVLVMDPTASPPPSPYFDVGKNGWTYEFVIGRDGKLAWRGNPATKEKEFLSALKKALDEKPSPPLKGELDAALDGAVSLYHAGRFAEAKEAALKAKAKTPNAAEGADLLAAAVDSMPERLLGEANRAAEAKEELAFVEAVAALGEAFPQSPQAKAAKELEKTASTDASFAAELASARAWIALRDRRPVLFPASKDGASKSYAHELEQFAKEHPGDGGESRAAADLLARFAK